jgi:hypothetical protein
MRVLRDNRDSLMAMLEAFVYDPLISWRLLAEESSSNVTSNAVVTSGGVGPTAQQQKSPVEQVLHVLDTHDGNGNNNMNNGSSSTASALVGGAATIIDVGELSPKRPTLVGAASMRDNLLRRSISHEKHELTNPTGGGGGGNTGNTNDEQPLQENLNAR